MSSKTQYKDAIKRLNHSNSELTQTNEKLTYQLRMANIRISDYQKRIYKKRWWKFWKIK